MASSGLVNLVCVLLIGAIVAAPKAEAVIPCSTVITRISSCIGYIQRGGALPPSCCDGIRTTYGQIRSTPELQSVCSCLKTVIPSVNGKANFVNSIPGKCGIKIPYTYYPSIDCSKVH